MSIRTWTRAAIALGVAVLGTTPATATDKGWYLGMSLGESTFNHEVADFDDGSLAAGGVDDSDGGWKLFGGYRLSRHLAVEGGYAVLNYHPDGETTFFGGTSDGTGTSFASGGVGVDLHRPQALFASVVGMVPVGRNALFCGKLGIQTSETEVTIFDSDGLRENDERGTAPLVGLGVSYRITKRWAVRAEWERFMDIVDDDIDLASMGITLALGSR